MAGVLPPPPVNDKMGSFSWLEWYRQLRNYVATSGSVPWYIINFANSNIIDIAKRDHNQLQDLQGGAAGEMFHLTSSQATSVSNIVSGWHPASAITIQTAPSAATVAAGATPTKAEFDALVNSYNSLRTILINYGLLI